MCMVCHMAPVKRPVIPTPATFPIPAAHVCMCTQKNIPCSGLRQVRNLSGDFGLSVPLSARKQENKLSSLEDFGADQGSEMRGLSYSVPYTRLTRLHPWYQQQTLSPDVCYVFKPRLFQGELWGHYRNLSEVCPWAEAPSHLSHFSSTTNKAIEEPANPSLPTACDGRKLG